MVASCIPLFCMEFGKRKWKVGPVGCKSDAESSPVVLATAAPGPRRGCVASCAVSLSRPQPLHGPHPRHHLLRALSTGCPLATTWPSALATVSSSPGAAPVFHPSSSASTSPPLPSATSPTFDGSLPDARRPQPYYQAGCFSRPFAAHRSHEDLHQDRRQRGDQPLLWQAGRQKP